MAANEDTTGAEERAEQTEQTTAETSAADAGQAAAESPVEDGATVTQAQADAAEGADTPERTAVAADLEDEAETDTAAEPETDEAPGAPALQFDPTDPFAVPANVMEILRTEKSERRPARDERPARGAEDEDEAPGRSRRRRRPSRERDQAETEAGAEDEAVETAEGIWDSINAPNLVENILPTRSRATLVLLKGADHTVDRVRLRRL